MTDSNPNEPTVEITDEMGEQVMKWVDQGVETVESGWKRAIRELGKPAVADSVSEVTPVEPDTTTEPERELYPSEQRRRDRAMTAELLVNANEYPDGRVAYLCLPENVSEARRLGLLSAEQIEEAQRLGLIQPEDIE